MSSRFLIVGGTIVDDAGVVRGTGQTIELEADCAARLNGQVSPDQVDVAPVAPAPTIVAAFGNAGA